MKSSLATEGESMGLESGQVGLGVGGSWPTALMTGDLLAVTQDVARSIHQEAKGDHYKALELAYARIAAIGLISSDEVNKLTLLANAVRDSQGQESVPHIVTQRVRSLYHEMTADPQSSPVAVALASGVNSLLAPIHAVDGKGTEVVVYFTSRQGVGIGGLIGGTIGALLGAATGPEGAVAGAAIGFSVGGALGASFGIDD